MNSRTGGDSNENSDQPAKSGQTVVSNSRTQSESDSKTNEDVICLRESSPRTRDQIRERIRVMNGIFAQSLNKRKRKLDENDQEDQEEGEVVLSS